jgi:hypothetical protein
LIKLEGILLGGIIGSHGPVAIQNIADERRFFGIEQEPRPLNEGFRAESEECRARLKTSHFRLRVNTPNMQAVPLSQCSVLGGRQVKIGVAKIPEIRRPSS